MVPGNFKVGRLALACALSFFLTASWQARGQSATPGKPAAVRGESIDGGAAPAPPPAATNASNKIVVRMVAGVIDAGFDTLASYSFNVPDMTASNHISVAQAEKQIPDEIRKLDGKTVRVRGFMMPVKEVQGKTTEFLIMRGQPSCCFSGATEITEFVTVKAPGKGFDTLLDDPITVEGTLHVGALTDSGFIVGLYRLDGEKLIAPGN